jgi:hypothetical protein
MRPTTTAVALTSLVLLAACGKIRVGGERSVEEENDRLRAQVHEQADRIKALEGERAELQAKLGEAKKNGQAPLPADATDAIPRVTSVKISMLSGLSPVDRAKPATELTVTFLPHDGRGRFTQAVGSATVDAFLTPTAAGGEPTRLAKATFTPAQLRDAYRSDLTGTYYLLRLPLETAIERAGGNPSVLVNLEFADALTGEVHKAERLLAPVQSPTTGSESKP